MRNLRNEPVPVSGLVRTIRNIKRGEALIITPRVDEWRIKHPDGIVWDDEAVEMFRSLVQRSSGNDTETRTGRFGASARGTCQRRQIFQFLGMPVSSHIDAILANLFDDGKWRHLRWQMMLLQSGIATHTEWPANVPSRRLKTSLDALNDDEGWGFELKGKSFYGSNSMNSIVRMSHSLQMHTMMLATGYETFIYVVEDKQSQNFQEVIVRRDPVVMNMVKKELGELNESVEKEKLPPILPECEVHQGQWKQCPFKNECLSQREWPIERKWGDSR